MSCWVRTKSAAKSAADVVERGAKRLACKAEILNKRRIIRNLKQEFGIKVYMSFENKDMEKVNAIWDSLHKAVEQKNEEIHVLEEKILALEHREGYHVLSGVLTWKELTVPMPQDNLTCHRCDEPIMGGNKAIECGAGDCFFHPTCFTCDSCGKEFTTKKCLFLEGKPNCEFCIEKSPLPSEDELLRWCNENIANFNLIDIKNFTTSWSNGLAFAALIANWRPDVLDWKSISPNEHIQTIMVAFAGIEKVGIETLLDADHLNETDKKSIMRQISLIQRHFNSIKPNPDGKKQWNTYVTAHPTYIVPSSTIKTEPELTVTRPVSQVVKT